MINTDRLDIHPATEEEMVSFIARIEDENLRGAYAEIEDDELRCDALNGIQGHIVYDMYFNA